MLHFSLLCFSAAALKYPFLDLACILIPPGPGVIAVPDFYAICQFIWQKLLDCAKSAATDDDSGVYDGDLTSDEQFIYFCVVTEAGIPAHSESASFVQVHGCDVSDRYMVSFC